jgi:hypothetical protein
MGKSRVDVRDYQLTFRLGACDKIVNLLFAQGNDHLTVPAKKSDAQTGGKSLEFNPIHAREPGQGVPRDPIFGCFKRFRSYFHGDRFYRKRGRWSSHKKPPTEAGG